MTIRAGGQHRRARLWLALALPLLLGAVLPVGAATIVRGPYLQSGSHERVVVRWRTDVATDSRVWCGTTLGSLSICADQAGAGIDHVVPLDALSPDTRYYYAVGSSSEQLAGDDADHFFFTAPPAGVSKPTRIWILGDSGTGDGNAAAVRDAYYNYTGATHTDLWLMLGDNAYPDGTDAEYQTALFDMYPEMLRKSVLWPTIGNHDLQDTGAGTWPYFDVFTLPKTGEAGGLGSGLEDYYSFDYGNIHFVVLDSQNAARVPSSTMLAWLGADLAATTADWVIAYWHHPPYTKGSHDSDNELNLMEMRQYVVPILDNHGVDLTFAGHSHDYERSFLIDGHYGLSTTWNPGFLVDAGDGMEGGDGAYTKLGLGSVPHTGAVHTVSGSAGKITGGPLDHPAMFVSHNLLGSVVLDVDAGRLDAVFLDDNGVVQDQWTMFKGSQPLPPSADFDAAPRKGSAPLTVLFFDETFNNPTEWYWDFEDDGQTDSTLQNPVHIYSQPGLYNVRETVVNGIGLDDEMRLQYVCVTAGIPQTVSALSFAADGETMSWLPQSGGTVYDTMRGNLLALRTSGGDFSTAGMECIRDDGMSSDAVDNTTPDSGQAFFYIVRAVNCTDQHGSYDSSGTGQVASRDDSMLGIPAACPCDMTNDVDQDAVCNEMDVCPVDADNDVDGDGHCANTDLCPSAYDPGQEDVDGDFFGDACDNCPSGWNANQTDSDSDGIGNLCDNCMNAANPGQEDGDADGYGDVCDNCPAASNTNQQDGDLDGIGDVCDVCPSDPFDDDDADGHCGNVDNCPTLHNPAQADGDTDGLGDLCDACPNDPANDVDSDGFCGDVDNCPAVANPGQQDVDADGVGNSCDNCIGVPNSNQTDSDGDGAGNVCDVCPLDDEDDIDADGLCANVDNCPNHANADQKDTDGDGVGNRCDNCSQAWNPDQTDSDFDGRGDACDPTP